MFIKHKILVFTDRVWKSITKLYTVKVRINLKFPHKFINLNKCLLVLQNFLRLSPILKFRLSRNSRNVFQWNSLLHDFLSKPKIFFYQEEFVTTNKKENLTEQGLVNKISGIKHFNRASKTFVELSKTYNAAHCLGNKRHLFISTQFVQLLFLIQLIGNKTSLNLSFCC